MRENRTYGSEGGEANAFPTPISDGAGSRQKGEPSGSRGGWGDKSRTVGGPVSLGVPVLKLYAQA
jgi:hypothetical protein